MKKVIKCTCIDYTFDGLGVCKDQNGTPIFVPGMIKDEVGEISYNETKKSFYNGQLERLDKVSSQRKEPLCPLFGFCGGCQLMHMSYLEQCDFKTNHVKEVLKRIGGIDVEVNSILENKNELRYRNKVQVSYAKDYKDRIIGGFYMEGTHQIVNRDDCYLENEISTKIVNYFKKLIKDLNIEPYDRSSPYGSIRHVLVRSSSLNEIMVVIITFGKYLPKSKEIVSKLIKEFPQIKTIVHNINSTKGNQILGKEEKVLYGKGYINDVLCGLKFKISPKSFYQVNHDQTEVLYDYAIKLATLSGEEDVLDAYCGIGTIGLIASKKAKHVTGVEIIEDAIKNAKENAKNNNITNVSFFVGDATKFMVEQAKKKKHFDVVFIDPPRGGCDSLLLKTLINTQPHKIIYISCNPSTLARDLKILKEKYEVINVQPVDMFSQTYHVETICALTLKK